jgi:hypothetical protein
VGEVGLCVLFAMLLFEISCHTRLKYFLTNSLLQRSALSLCEIFFLSYRDSMYLDEVFRLQSDDNSIFLLQVSFVSHKESHKCR